MSAIIHFTCDYCGGPGQQYRSEYIKKERHFCKRDCYALWLKNVAKPEDNNAWKGGISSEESRRRWTEKNKAKAAALVRARRLREINAPGSHTKEDWERVKASYPNGCAEFDETCKGKVTKDHIVPLIMGGSQNPENLQPLCHSHNSRKSRKVYLGTFTPVNI